MKTIDQWLSEYASSHQNPINKTIHRICVPLIYFTIVAFFYCVHLYTFANGFDLTLAHLVVLVVAIYYILLSLPLAVGMIVYSALCIIACSLIQVASQGNLGWIALAIFVVAWMFQFWGHSIEGKKPSFFKDIQFLMIGPGWVLTSVIKKVS